MRAAPEEDRPAVSFPAGRRRPAFPANRRRPAVSFPAGRRRPAFPANRRRRVPEEDRRRAYHQDPEGGRASC